MIVDMLDDHLLKDLPKTYTMPAPPKGFRPSTWREMVKKTTKKLHKIATNGKN